MGRRRVAVERLECGSVAQLLCRGHICQRDFIAAHLIILVYVAEHAIEGRSTRNVHRGLSAIRILALSVSSEFDRVLDTFSRTQGAKHGLRCFDQEWCNFPKLNTPTFVHDELDNRLIQSTALANSRPRSIVERLDIVPSSIKILKALHEPTTDRSFAV